MAHSTKQRLEDIRKQLSAADSMLDHGLMAINRGCRLDAMENVYAASCMIEEIMAVLETGQTVETRTACRDFRHQ